jgi:hypothetical protein
MAVNIPRIESAHGVVTLHSTVHDGSISLLCNTLLGDLGVDPIWESPRSRLSNLSKFDWGARVVLNRLLKGRIEFAIVEEHVGVVIPSVEVTLDGLDGLDDTF